MRVTSQKAICLYFKSSLLSTYKWCPEAEKRQRRRWWLFLGAFFVSENGDKCGTLFFEKNYRRSWEDRLPANENHLIDWKLKGNDRSKSRVKILLKTRERLRHAIQHPDDFLKPRSLKNCDAVLLFSQMSSRILSLSLSLCAIRWVERVTSSFFLWLERKHVHTYVFKLESNVALFQFVLASF